MTESQLRQAIEEKGYTYKEETQTHGAPKIVALKDDTRRFIGHKDLLLNSSLAFFKQSTAYCKL